MNSESLSSDSDSSDSDNLDADNSDPSQIPTMVTVENLQNHLPVEADRVEALVRFVLKGEGEAGEISICFVDDDRITELHGEFLNDPTPTDVITFPLGDDDSRTLEGEIVVSSEAAIRQAGDHQSTPLQELHLYVIHGVLHLAGYDDLSAAEAGEMSRIQEGYLSSWIALNGPFTD